MAAIEVFNEFVKGPLAAEGALILDSCLLAHSEVVHNPLSAPLEAESLLDPDDDL